MIDAPLTEDGDCPNCGRKDEELTWHTCCGRWMCDRCSDRHDERYGHAEEAPAATAASVICWGLSSFCAETGHKCRAVGACVFSPPSP